MANLIVRNLDEDIVAALKKRAASHAVSAEEEHRRILASVLGVTHKKSFSEALLSIPAHSDPDDVFAPVDDDGAVNVFN